jgi:hypothetical protein
MNLEAVDQSFAEMIHKKGIATALGIDMNYVYQLRSKLKNNVGISLDTKLELLRKSGWKEDDARYTQKDLVSLAKFVLSTSAKAREFGAEYIVEKWKAKN